MEDLTLALVTLTSFVLLFVVAVFADRAGSDMDATRTELESDGIAPPDPLVDGSGLHADVA